eukprot:758916-Pelagomonas_calceolata.AAC.2
MCDGAPAGVALCNRGYSKGVMGSKGQEAAAAAEGQERSPHRRWVQVLWVQPLSEGQERSRHCKWGAIKMGAVKVGALVVGAFVLSERQERGTENVSALQVGAIKVGAIRVGALVAQARSGNNDMQGTEHSSIEAVRK